MSPFQNIKHHLIGRLENSIVNFLSPHNGRSDGVAHSKAGDKRQGLSRVGVPASQNLGRNRPTPRRSDPSGSCLSIAYFFRAGRSHSDSALRRVRFNNLVNLTFCAGDNQSDCIKTGHNCRQKEKLYRESFLATGRCSGRKRVICSRRDAR